MNCGFTVFKNAYLGAIICPTYEIEHAPKALQTKVTGNLQAYAAQIVSDRCSNVVAMSFKRFLPIKNKEDKRSVHKNHTYVESDADWFLYQP